MSESCANPLLLGWIKEWLDQARERNSKGVTVYKKAYESMKACPLVFQHPSEAQQLNGLGPKLCDRLTEKLKAYCEENGLPMPEPPHKAASSKRASGENLPGDQPAKKPRKAKPYVPALRSGPYALLLGLATLDENSSTGMTKQQLIDVAQPYCDTSFTAPSDPTKFYTAWNSMKTLVQKDLVYEHGRPLRRYALTEEGWEVAKRIQNTLPGASHNPLSFGNEPATRTLHRDTGNNTLPATIPSRPPISKPTQPNPPNRSNTIVPDFLDLDDEEPPAPSTHNNLAQTTTTTPTQPIPLPPNSFTVQLILDTREVRTAKDRDYIANELSKKGITPEVRALELGDAMWVAKCHDPSFMARHGEEGGEVMLDWIVERKRLDDLISSIKDGRFHEQKFRLRRSGVRNVIYLVEEFAVSLHDPAAAKYQEMVASAIASTQVVNGYFVKKTKGLDDTIRYLARMTFMLRRMFEGDTPTRSVSLIPSHQLSSAQSYLSTLEELRAENPTVTFAVTFPTFAALTSKSDVLSLRDVFLKMLMCTRGVTGEKAIEIQRRWKTPRELMEAFEALGEKEKEMMMSEKMKTLVGRKKIQKALSKRIAEVWGESG